MGMLPLQHLLIHSPGKPGKHGKVRELNSGQGKVRENGKSHGKVRESYNHHLAAARETDIIAFLRYQSIHSSM